ncbi:3-methyl-2-oxobutanoate hydroxymethyltransferase [Pseudomonas mohnii]
MNVLGGFKVQGRDQDQARALIETAKKLEGAGAAMIVVEAVPSSLEEDLSEAVVLALIEN